MNECVVQLWMMGCVQDGSISNEWICCTAMNDGTYMCAR